MTNFVFQAARRLCKDPGQFTGGPCHEIPFWEIKNPWNRCVPMIWLRAPKWFCARVVAVAPTSPLPARAVLRLRPLRQKSTPDAEVNEQVPHRLIRQFDARISGLSRSLLPALAYYAVRSMFGFCSPLLHLGSPRWHLSALMKKCV